MQINSQPTISEWLAYAEDHGVHKAVITYINKFPSDLGLKNIKPGETSPSPRSWVNLSDCMIYMAEHNHDPLNENYFTLLCKIFLSNTIAVNFVEHVKNYKVYKAPKIGDM